MSDAERYEEIFDAVSHGAADHEPVMADDMMFLCGYIQEMQSALAIQKAVLGGVVKAMVAQL